MSGCRRSKDDANKPRRFKLIRVNCMIKSDKVKDRRFKMSRLFVWHIFSDNLLIRVFDLLESSIQDIDINISLKSRQKKHLQNVLQYLIFTLATHLNSQLETISRV